MKVDLFAFCMAASRGSFGELNILGLTDIVVLPKFPAALTSCSIVAKMRFDEVEAGPKEVKFSIINADGRILASPPPQTFNIQLPPGAPSATVGTVVGLINLLIPTPGQYQIGMAVNQREEGTIPLHFLQMLSNQTPLAGQQAA
jgi:hypothetical protein